MRIRPVIFIVVIAIALQMPIVFAQQQQQEPADEPIRITTELVQTGVVVVDKQGNSSTACARTSSYSKSMVNRLLPLSSNM
jgi:hypothetical protein